METSTYNVLMTGQKHRLSQRFIQRQMKALGNSCQVVEVTRTFSPDAYRTPSEEYVYHNDVICFVNILTEADTSVKEGEARAGDLIFSFDSSSKDFLKQGYRIVWNSETFQIYDVRPFNAIGNTNYLIECLTKKYSDNSIPEQ